jgi:hypothetical protein
MRVIHNMIARKRCDPYMGTTSIPSFVSDVHPSGLIRIRGPSNVYEQIEFWRERVDTIENADERFMLRESLVQHIWSIACSR